MRRLAALAVATVLAAGACSEVPSVVLRLLGGLTGLSEASAPPSAPAASPSASGDLDQAALATALERLAADPRDTAALMEIADLYYAAGDFASSAAWFDRLLAIEPENATALLAKGASLYNLGDAAAAEGTWKRVVELDPANVEAHYDLGFLYVNLDPPDLAGARQEWSTVIVLDPEGGAADRVRALLAALEESTASPAP